MQKKQSPAEAPEGRRAFLKTLGLAGGAAAVAVASGEALARSAEAVTEPESKASGYRETAHIRSYYRTARG